MVQVGKQRDFVTSAVGQCVGLHHGDRLYAGVSVLRDNESSCDKQI